MKTKGAPARSRAESWALALLILSSLFLQLFRLDWGLPAWRRSLLTFGSKEKIEAASQAEMQKLTGGLQLPPGMKLPF